MSRPSISTATGDNGTTGLYGGKRVSKASDRIHTYGDVDELNALIGVLIAEELPETVRKQLVEVQRMLFILGADLASPQTSPKVPRISERHVAIVEQWGEALEKDLPKLQHFILPSGSRAGSLAHHARTVCRRTERWAVALAAKEKVSPEALIFMNRLSDYLFIVARTINKASGAAETQWIAE